MTQERDYVLGTHDEEITRLGLQHRVWRARTQDAWRRAGFAAGQTILDIGSGPGYATLDLADIVGPSGRVVALDRSRRFLDALEGGVQARGLANVTTVELDLDRDPLPGRAADGAWSRWVFAFVQDPRSLVARVAAALKPGGVLVALEYLHYVTWQLSPRSPEFEEFVRAVVDSWHDTGGEPDVGLDLPRWLEEQGFEIKSLTPIVDFISPSSPVWPWPKAFVDVGLRRLVSLGKVSAERARDITAAFAAAEAAPGTYMVNPMVVEIIAQRRG